jgi:hypothetical protein
MLNIKLFLYKIAILQFHFYARVATNLIYDLMIE